jgi:hypothetical protein
MSETVNTQAETGKKGRMSAVDHIGSSDRGTASDERNPLGIFPYLRVRYFSDDGSRCNRRDADGSQGRGMAGADFRRNQLLSGGDRLLCVQHYAV